MSSAAKETLVKSVAQAIPCHAMSVFKFSAGLCDDLSQIIRNFWWGDEEDQRKTHWMGWDKMTRPKLQGGIGFRDLRLFNQALLAKQAWRLIEHPESLCARVLKARYYPAGDLIDTAFIKNSSPCWQGIAHGLDLLKKGVIWRVVNGEKIRIWRDNWVPRGNLKVFGNASKSRLRWVSDFIDPSSKSWKEDLVRTIFHPPDAEMVLNIRIPSFNGNDYIAWNHENNGFFSVKSAYRLAVEINSKTDGAGQSCRPPGERDLWKIIWNAKVPPKVRVFAWKLATDTLGVQVLRYERNMEHLPTCQICGVEAETSHHAVMICTKAKALRQKMRDTWYLPDEEKLKFTGKDWVLILLNQVDTETRSKLMLLWWGSWHLRNNIIFGDGKCNIEESAIFLQSYLSPMQVTNTNWDVVDPKGKKPVFCQDEQTDSKPKKIAEGWKPPDMGWAKLNTDASFSEDTNSGAWGAVLRDKNGTIILSAWGNIQHCSNAEAAEAFACLRNQSYHPELRRPYDCRKRLCHSNQ
jgi:hypothetical protein